MPKFVCKHCGMITDNPKIVPDMRLGFKELFSKKGNYFITCPVCLNKTYFWRDEPFPADTMTNKKKGAER